MVTAVGLSLVALLGAGGMAMFFRHKHASRPRARVSPPVEREGARAEHLAHVGALGEAVVGSMRPCVRALLTHVALLRDLAFRGAASPNEVDTIGRHARAARDAGARLEAVLAHVAALAADREEGPVAIDALARHVALLTEEPLRARRVALALDIEPGRLLARVDGVAFERVLVELLTQTTLANGANLLRLHVRREPAAILVELSAAASSPDAPELLGPCGRDLATAAGARVRERVEGRTRTVRFDLCLSPLEARAIA